MSEACDGKHGNRGKEETRYICVGKGSQATEYN